jgi:hypothetical protein
MVSIVELSRFSLKSLVGRFCQGLAPNAHIGGSPRGLGHARPETKTRARGAFAVTTIDFRIDPLPLGATVSSLVTHADVPDIDWADDETGCDVVRGVVERSEPIRIVSGRR